MSFFIYLVGFNRLMYMLKVWWCAYLAKQHKMYRDGVKVLGVVPILFGWFLRVPSLHVLVFVQKTFL